jgi:hypothetical protein
MKLGLVPARDGRSASCWRHYSIGRSRRARRGILGGEMGSLGSGAVRQRRGVKTSGSSGALIVDTTILMTTPLRRIVRTASIRRETTVPYGPDHV